LTLRRLVRRAPTLGRSHRRCAELERERNAIELELAKANEAIGELRQAEAGSSPSFYKRLAMLRRSYTTMKSLGFQHPIWTLNAKHAGYQFARSHGLATPRKIANCADVSEISWGELPDSFVLKTLHGAASRGVLPLVRRGNKYLDLLATARGPMSPAEIEAYLRQQKQAGKVSSRLTIEELIPSPHNSQPTLAPDLKLYCFYGAVGLVMVRTTNGSRDRHSFQYRHFDEHGADLGEALIGRNVNRSVPAPLHLDELVEAGRMLSAAIPSPFARIDFYENSDSIIFGEITPRPGGPQRPRPDLDIRLGTLWEEAEARLVNDLAESGSLTPRIGPHSDKLAAEKSQGISRG
jgi:hypothetical protein